MAKIIKKSEHNVNHKNTFCSNASIGSQIIELLDRHGLTWENVGWKYENWLSKKKGRTRWNMDDIDMVAQTLKRKGVNLELRLIDKDRIGERTSDMNLEKEIEQLRVQNQILQGKIDAMLEMSRAQSSPFPTPQDGKTG